MSVFYQIAKKIIEIRRFEENLLTLFSNGDLFGTTHTSIGQEGISATLATLLDIDKDSVMSSHRCHGHYLALGGDPELLLREIMGRETGLCGGRGGSQHIKYKNFYSNGIQGGVVGNGAGIALSKKIFGKGDGIAVAFLGDGTLGQGLVYESFNFSSKHELPILYIVENNRYAQSTPVEAALAGSIDARAQAFGISFVETSSNDPRKLYHEFRRAVNYVRDERKPFVLIAQTYRLGPHSKGDDFRDQAEVGQFSAFDPLIYAREILGEDEFDIIDRSAVNKVTMYTSNSREYPFAELVSPDESITSEIVDRLKSKPVSHDVSDQNVPQSITFLNSINMGLKGFLDIYKTGFLIGEDIIDPYGGAFKVTKGISSAYPGRVISSPISEAGMVAWATGAALTGARPVVEVMFSDFLTLAYDQLLNHATKYRWMYNRQVECPVIIRTASGGGRGYGPTHSQSIEKYFIGMQGLTIVAPSLFDCPGELLINLSVVSAPCIFVEHKTLYPKKLIDVLDGRFNEFFVKRIPGSFPITSFSLADKVGGNPVLLTYGAMAMPALQAVKRLAIEEEIEVDVVLVSLLQPLQIEELISLLEKISVLFVLDENDSYGGWGAEVISQLVSRCNFQFIRRIAARDLPLPASGPLEAKVIPQSEDIYNIMLDVLE